jgi:DNA-directed RNA polymerase specialized sigma subunit
MGENVNVLIKEFKDGNKEKFLLIVEKMTPLINKYVRLLYKDEKEDMHSEFVLCLLEAINAMSYYKEEGQCIYFLSRALKTKFLELYKKSKLHFESEIVTEDEFFTTIDRNPSEYEDCVIIQDLKEMLSKMDGKQNGILCDIIFNDLSDAAIAKKNSISRQYVNRVRRNFYELLKEKYFK